MCSAVQTATPRLVGRFHVVTDARHPQRVLPVVQAVLAAYRQVDDGARARLGPLTVQVRAKPDQATDRQLFDLACEVRDLVPQENCLVLVDDRVDIALAAQCDGVHVGDHDLPPQQARHVLVQAGMRSPVMGVTVRCARTAAIAHAQGATYVGAGPVFSTTTKNVAAPMMGLTGLGALTEQARLPVIAIAGIDLTNVEDAFLAGAHGVAVVSALSASPDPQATAAEFFHRILAAIETSAPSTSTSAASHGH